MQGENFHADVTGVVQTCNFAARPETKPGSAGEQPCEGYGRDAHARTGRRLSRRRPFTMRSVPCLEKPDDEPLAVLLRHAAVVVQVLLKVGENPFNLVVRVRHAGALPEGEQVREIEVDAVHRRFEPAVRVMRPPRPFRHGTPVDEYVPLLFPTSVSLGEPVPVAPCQPAYQQQQLSGCQHPGLPCQVSPDYLAHVELAHLHLVRRELPEQAAHTVDDNPVDPVPPRLD